MYAHVYIGAASFYFLIKLALYMRLNVCVIA